MHAIDVEVINFLGINNLQFFVPNYQRDYSWSKKNCERLLNDILNVAKDSTRPTYYIGSVLYIPESFNISAVNKCMIIDGQQRLTTISLLLLALGEYTASYCEKNNLPLEDFSTRTEVLHNTYLVNPYKNGESHYRLKLKGADFDEYKTLLEHPNYAAEHSGRIAENYMLILNWLKDLDEDPEKIFSGIAKLKIVDTKLDPQENGQLVFESVNSTGLPLSAADKIRNFLIVNYPRLKSRACPYLKLSLQLAKFKR